MSWPTSYGGFSPSLPGYAPQQFGYSSQGYPVYTTPLTPPPAVQGSRAPQPRPRPAMFSAPPSPAHTGGYPNSVPIPPAPAAPAPAAAPQQSPQHTPAHRPQAAPLSGPLHVNAESAAHPSNPDWTPAGKAPLKNIRSADVVEDHERRQYHIGLAPGEVAPNIILVGDPARSAKVKELFDEGSVRTHVVVREFVTFTGTYKGLPISVISTGIGPPNVEIVLIELSHIVEPNAIIRVGSCGSLQPQINVGDLVISTGAVRLEDTSLRFVEQSYPCIAHYESVLALLSAARRLGFPHHVGITASSSGFYGGQGRQVPGFPVNDLTMVDQLAARNVYNFEMESSTLFTLASIKGWRAGTVCAAFANRPSNTFIGSDKKEEAERTAILCGLEALLLIDKLNVSVDGEAPVPLR